MTHVLDGNAVLVNSGSQCAHYYFLAICFYHFDKIGFVSCPKKFPNFLVIVHWLGSSISYHVWT